MTKAVRAVGNAIGNVVKGVVNVVSSVTQTVAKAATSVVKTAVNVVRSVAEPVVEVVKKVASSKIGKVVLTAAAVYFGGAALAGGFGTIGTSTSFLSGMGTGVANAASSLSTAWSATMAGNFSQAGSALASGVQGQAANGIVQAGTSAAQTVANATAANTAAGAAKGATAAGTGFFSSPYTAPAMITAGSSLIGGVIAAKGQQQMIDEQRAYEQNRTNTVNENQSQDLWGGGGGGSSSQPQTQAQMNLAMYNANNSQNLWGNSSGGGSSMTSYDPVAEAKAIGQRYKSEFDKKYAVTQNADGSTSTGDPYLDELERRYRLGLISRGMAGNPTTNNGFTVYNPYYFNS